MKALSLPLNLKKLYTHWAKLQQVQKLYANKDWYGCIEGSNELIKQMNNDFFGFYYRGLANVELKLFDEAISDFEVSLVNLEKNRFPAIMQDYKRDVNFRITWVFRLQRKYSEALEHINSTLTNFPNYVDAYRLKADIYEDLGELENSLNAIETGLNSEPANSELLDCKNYFGQLIMAEKEDNVSG